MAVGGAIDIDGVVHAAADAKISVLDRGFLYGDSAFEAMRTYRGVAFRQREHLERLQRSCERLRIAMPLSLDELALRVARAVERSGEPECYLRIVVTRGAGPMGLDLTLAQGPSVVVYALPLKAPDPALYARGIAVHLARVTRSTDDSPAAGAKTSNYLASMLALDDARQRGAQEAIIVDRDDHVVEGTTSNVFALRGGVLRTPPIESGILEGITRRTVIELCGECGLRCEEAPLRSAELTGADEVFITSSIREIVPVVRADDIVIGDGTPGAITKQLHDAYRKRTR